MSDFMTRAIGLRTPAPMTTDQLHRIAPSIFADKPRGHLSDRYSFVSTAEVIEGLRGAGFMPVFARQSSSMGVDRVPYARHEIRFRHASTAAMTNALHTPGVHTFLKGAPTEFDEISLINSHDGTTPFMLSHGIFRVVCSNGLIVCSRGLAEVRIRHAGNIVDNVIEGATRVLEQADTVRELREEMRALELDKQEQHVFAQAALALRYGDEPVPIEAPQLLEARRVEDVDPSLWNVFNVVQENLIRGGVRGHTTSGRRMTTRPITSITTDLTLNRMLWNLAEAARNMKQSLGGVFAVNPDAEVADEDVIAA